MTEKCSRCGRFINFDTGAILTRFTPDTHFSSEKAEFVCAKCHHKSCAVCGGIQIDANGYCVKCRILRGLISREDE